MSENTKKIEVENLSFRRRSLELSGVIRFAYTATISYLLLFCVVESAFAESKKDSSSEPQRKIRNIRIEIRDIFDDDELGAFYDGVNGLKVNTREEVVRRELLFVEGDTYDEFLLQESERNLRQLSFLRQVSIIPIPDGEFVDVIVSVQDTWTLFPQVGFATGGGSDKSSVGLVEKNILGYGKSIELLYREDDGRETVQGVWEDTRVLGSYHRLLLGYFDRSDGFRSVTSFGRPFRSLTEKYSWSFNSDFFDLVGKLYEAGDERYIFRERRNTAGAGFTISGGEPEVRRRRMTFGYRYLEDTFKEADEDDFDDVDVDPDSVSRDPALLADDRKYSGPFVAFEQIIPDYLSINYVDRFERVEDFNLGNELRINAGFAADIFGSEEDTVLFDLRDAQGYRVSPTSFVRGELGVSGRADHVGFDNVVFQAQVKYFNVVGPKFHGGYYVGKHTVVASLTLDYGEDMDRDREFLLGAENGLRGYEDRTFTGDQRLSMVLEDRFHVAENILQLFNLGGAVFLDAGGTSNRGLGDVVSDELFADFGIGLRIGLPRSSGGTVVRVDLAFPLRDGPDGSDTLEPRLLITTGQLTNSRLRGESRSLVDTQSGLGFEK